jgi:hypothetical protein
VFTGRRTGCAGGSAGIRQTAGRSAGGYRAGLSEALILLINCTHFFCLYDNGANINENFQYAHKKITEFSRRSRKKLKIESFNLSFE